MPRSRNPLAKTWRRTRRWSYHQTGTELAYLALGIGASLVLLTLILVGTDKGWF